jgi:phospholipid/cholesterol/gamma-HCH transport system substrate-binding protein
MRRSVHITWDQLKVGATVLLGLGILAVSVYYIGRAANLFADRYTLVAFLPDAPGLRIGGSVMIAGQTAGSIKDITFMPVDGDTTRNLRVVMSIDRSLREQVRGDSKVKLRTLGLLGDKVLDIKPGTPRFAILSENDTLAVEPSLDLDAVLAQAAGAVDDVVGLTQDLRQITGGLVRGEGTMGQLLTDRALYDQFTGTMARTNALLTRVQTSRGTVGRLIDDPRLYDDMVGLVGSMNGLVGQINTSEGTVGKLLRDTTLYSNLVGITQGGDSLMTLLTQGDGLANKLLTDQTLYDQLNKLVTDLGAILADVRQDPAPYTKGLVNVCVFGCKKDK